MTVFINRRVFVGLSAAVLAMPSAGRAVARQERPTLRIVTDWVLDATPAPGSFDIQGESLFGNAEFLMRPTLDGPVPWLAESLEQVEPTRWRVTLKPGITFQNGNPLDAEALVACLAYYESPDNQGDAERATLGKPTSVEVSGPLSVDLVTPEPFARMGEGMAHYVNFIFDAKTALASKDDWSGLVDKGIFTGPYMWSSVEPGINRYVAYDDYWGGTPALAGVERIKAADDQAALQAIANGEADVLPYMSPSLATVATAFPDVHVRVGPGAGFIGLAFEASIAPFDEVDVRRAVALAIDNDAIAAAVGGGIATPLKGWFERGNEYAYDWMVHDPAGAEALLDGAGWAREGDGPRLKQGKPLEARFYCYTEIGEGVSTVAADMLKQVGFDATIRRFESYTDIPAVHSVDGGIYTVYTESLGLNGDPVGTMNVVVSGDYTVPAEQAWRDLLEPALSTTDPAIVKEAMLACQEYNAENAFWLPTIDGGTPYLVNDAYRNLDPNPFYLFVDATTAPES